MQRELPFHGAPDLPPEVVTFDCIDFGGYCSRGYNPNQIAGIIRGLPIGNLATGQWLGHANTGRSGSVFIFRDKEGKELGRAYKASKGVCEQMQREGKWESKLRFHPTQK